MLDCNSIRHHSHNIILLSFLDDEQFQDADSEGEYVIGNGYYTSTGDGGKSVFI